MKPVTKERRIQLEEQLGFSICPLTVEHRVELNPGIFANENTVIVYLCGKDFESARGGKPLNGSGSAAVTPCSMDYAESCESHSRYGHLLAIVYPELRYQKPA